MAGDARPRPSGRCRTGEARRAPDHGRRADLRLDRRHGRRGVELHRALGQESANWRATCSTACKAISPPGAMLHYGQGKWYPGEPLPRWALGCYWRTDGKPLWKQPQAAGDDGRRRHADDGRRHSASFNTWRSELGLDEGFVIPAFEDVTRIIDEEQRWPENFDPLKLDLKAADERRRVAKLIERGLGASGRLCAAAESLAAAKRSAVPPAPTFRRVSLQPVAAAARTSLPDPRRFAARPAPAAGFAALGGTRRTRKRKSVAIPSIRPKHLPDSARPRRSSLQVEAQSQLRRPRKSCTPPCAPKCATACCASSCRRCPCWKISSPC